MFCLESVRPERCTIQCTFSAYSGTVSRRCKSQVTSCRKEQTTCESATKSIADGRIPSRMMSIVPVRRRPPELAISRGSSCIPFVILASRCDGFLSPSQNCSRKFRITRFDVPITRTVGITVDCRQLGHNLRTELDAFPTGPTVYGPCSPCNMLGIGIAGTGGVAENCSELEPGARQNEWLCFCIS